MRRQTAPVARPRSGRRGRPGDLGVAEQPREHEVVEVGARLGRLRPERRLDAEDVALATPGDLRRRDPRCRRLGRWSCPAQTSPSGESGVYFMSRYAFVAGDMTTFAPCSTARRASAGSCQCCATEVRRSRVFADLLPADHPLAVRADDPLDPLDERAVLVRVGRVRLVAADVDVRPGRQRGELARPRRRRTAYVSSLRMQSELKPTSIPVYGRRRDAVARQLRVGGRARR